MSRGDPAGGSDPFETLWYSPSAGAAAGRTVLAPLSLLFGAAVRVRTQLYDRGLATALRASAPVISVGSLRVGGAGKTPFVLWLARELQRRGRRPCIVTRGYGGGASADPWVLDAVSAGEPGAAARAGDEAVLLALRSGGPVAIGADRVRACAAATEALARTGNGPDVFVLDDGFQHRRLVRDLDIVLVSGNEAAESLLPAGPLREPVAALARADAVVTMRARPAAALSSGEVGKSPGGLEAFPEVAGLVESAEQTQPTDAATLKGVRVLAVAAIARPERFVETLRGLGAEVAATVFRRDHHRYGDEDLREIERASSGAELVVTTEKDLVKLDGAGFRSPLVALRVETRFVDEAAGRQLADRAAGLHSDRQRLRTPPAAI